MVPPIAGLMAGGVPAPRPWYGLISRATILAMIREVGGYELAAQPALNKDAAFTREAVSYTHLTLPTILRV